jgi:RHS repeat-associated protein
MLRSGATSYYEADGLGSATSLTDGAGSAVSSYVYDSFGRQASPEGGVANAFRYTAREFDAATGLYYSRARYYDSGSGRFLSEDPLTAGGIHSYLYSDNRPTTLWDPSGLQSQVPLEASNYPYDVLYGTIERIRRFLPEDPDCLRFLCTNHGVPVDAIDQILLHRLLGVAWILPTTNPDGSLTITNAQTPGVVPGQAITVNLFGSFFNASYDGRELPREAGFRGGTSGAQGFIMLHELGHILGVLEADGGNQEAVDRNNALLRRNCRGLIRRLGRR